MLEVYLNNKIVFSSRNDEEVLQYCGTHDWDFVCEKLVRGVNLNR